MLRALSLKAVLLVRFVAVRIVVFTTHAETRLTRQGEQRPATEPHEGARERWLRYVHEHSEDDAQTFDMKADPAAFAIMLSPDFALSISGETPARSQIEPPATASTPLTPREIWLHAIQQLTQTTQVHADDSHNHAADASSVAAIQINQDTRPQPITLAHQSSWRFERVRPAAVSFETTNSDDQRQVSDLSSHGVDPAPATLQASGDHERITTDQPAHERMPTPQPSASTHHRIELSSFPVTDSRSTTGLQAHSASSLNPTRRQRESATPLKPENDPHRAKPHTPLNDMTVPSMRTETSSSDWLPEQLRQQRVWERTTTNRTFHRQQPPAPLDINDAERQTSQTESDLTGFNAELEWSRSEPNVSEFGNRWIELPDVPDSRDELQFDAEAFKADHLHQLDREQLASNRLWNAQRF